MHMIYVWSVNELYELSKKHGQVYFQPSVSAIQTQRRHESISDLEWDNVEAQNLEILVLSSGSQEKDYPRIHRFESWSNK